MDIEADPPESATKRVSSCDVRDAWNPVSETRVSIR
jgi:hypothetical protein